MYHLSGSVPGIWTFSCVLDKMLTLFVALTDVYCVLAVICPTCEYGVSERIGQSHCPLGRREVTCFKELWVFIWKKDELEAGFTLIPYHWSLSNSHYCLQWFLPSLRDANTFLYHLFDTWHLQADTCSLPGTWWNELL